MGRRRRVVYAVAMAQSKAATVAEYIASLPEERRLEIDAVRRLLLDNLPEGLEERMQYGMIGYVVPHSLYPAGYHCKPSEPLPFGGLAAQKGYLSLYLMAFYMDATLAKRFAQECKRAKKKVDLTGKSCVRFRTAADLPADALALLLRGMSVPAYIALYERKLRKGKTRKGTKVSRG